MMPETRLAHAPSFTLAGQWCHLIDITNHCPQACIYCTRYERHYRGDQLFHMTLAQIEQALRAYEGVPGGVGIIGGEPLVHPQFAEISALCRRYFPREKLHLFTALMPRAKWQEHRDLIAQTFGHLNANEHTPQQRALCRHQPTTLAVGEVCDEATAKELIDRCWVPRAWCCTVNHKGAFFCEVLAAMDVLLDGPGGWPVQAGWWRRTQSDCRGQRDRYCRLCSMCLPLQRQLMTEGKEKFTPGLLQLYREHNLTRLSASDVTVVDLKMTAQAVAAMKPGWEPWAYTVARESK
jgi:hypothetical protein